MVVGSVGDFSMNLIRNIKMDNYKGILIFLVVLGHLLFSYNYYNHEGILLIVKFIYSFHMPLFMIISGYYSKKVSKRSLFNFFLLFIFLVISYFLYDYILYDSNELFLVRYSAWYLFALLIYRCIFLNVKIKNFFLKYKNNVFIIGTLIIFLLLFFTENGTLSKVLGYFPFFLYGFLLDDTTLNTKRKNYICKGIICISTLILLVLFIPIPFNFFLNCNYRGLVDGLFRIIYFMLNIRLFLYLYDIISCKEIPFLTMIGKNSLVIYVMHRIFTLMITDYFIFSKYFILIAVISAFMLCFAFGNYFMKNIFDKLLNLFYMIFLKHKYIFCAFLILIILACIWVQFRGDINYYFSKTKAMPYETLEELDNSISIGFVGDLILLESQVKKSFDGNDYNFDYMFDNMSTYFNEVDYMIGVLEGPVDDTQEYSVSDFDDGKELRLNFPSAFLSSIENSGIDLVTTANNHLLDKGVNGVYNTIRNLDKSSLDYIGSYLDKNSNDNNRRKIVNVDGLSIGILAYNYGLNYYGEDEVFNDYFDLSNYLCESSSKYFLETKKRVIEDFDYLKSEKVDYIIVLPHYGTQFSTSPDNYQKIWNDIFVENGADVVLGDHTHSVQPIEYMGDAVIINSVGNYVNSYTNYDGDVSMMVKVYLNKKLRKVSTTSVIPILALPDSQGRYYGTAVHDLYYNNKGIQEKYLSRIKYANEFVGRVSMNAKIEFNIFEDEYYFIPRDGYVRYNDYSLELLDNDKDSLVYKKIQASNDICFVGDSITEGTLNGFKPWYLELVNLFEKEKRVYNFSKGGYTTDDIIEEYGSQLENSNCDLFIVNIGTNDIRYYEASAEEYKNKIIDILGFVNSRDIIFLSPWQTTDRDIHLYDGRDGKKRLYLQYNKVLEDISLSLDNVYYVDVNQYIRTVINNNGEDIYLLDGVHPNDLFGIRLYSYAVLRGLATQ